ncbi:MAG: S8 family serine peptidase [Myxococcota bacterium]
MQVLRARAEHLASRGERAATRRTRTPSTARRRSAGRGPTTDAVNKEASRERFESLAHVYRVSVAPDVSLEAAAQALSADPHVEYAQPDYAHELDQAAPTFNDPFLASEGTWGQPYSDLWGLERVGAPEAWSIAQGAGAIVAVVDSGLDRFHPDIAANIWVNPGEDLDGDGRATAADENGIDDDGNGFIDDLTGFDFANSIDADEDGRYDGPDDVSDPDPFDDNGHGTHIAGTIAAVAGNGLGIVGVAPAAKIMALKGFPAEGSASDSVLWRAVLYAAENEASVINTSWSCGRRCPTNPLAEEMLEIVEGLGAVVVTSAGNASEDVLFRSPENTSAVITVGSMGAFDQLSTFSNRGWLLDLVAPGGGPSGTPGVRVSRRNVLSLLSSGASENQRSFAVDDQYLRLSGTSMSAPHVTGAVAILRALRPELSPREVRHLLRASAEDLGSAGQDPEFGAGLLDLPGLLSMPALRVDFELTAPRAGTVHDPRDGRLRIEAKATGLDLASVDVAVGRGLSPLAMRPLASFGASRVDADADPETGVFTADWDTEAVEDGPYVIRLRARLEDGRTLEEYTVVGIERNHPIALSALTADAGGPTLDGAQVYWHRDEIVEGRPTPQTHDPYSMRFPSNAWRARGFESTPKKLLDGAGDQRSLAADQGEIAWVVNRDGVNRIEHCRRPNGSGECDAREVTSAPGRMGNPFIANGWLVWMRTNAGETFIEGCPVGEVDPICRARPLIDPAFLDSGFLQSFDGHTLLLRSPQAVSLCRLPSSDVDAGAGAASGVEAELDAPLGGAGCVPEPIEFAPGVALPIEPVHAEDLLAFSRVGVEPVWPPGCTPGVYSATCFPSSELVVEYLACTMSAVNSADDFGAGGASPLLCDPVPVSGPVLVNAAQGLAISPRRVVWSVGAADESASIHFCEFDRDRRLCPAQRLGGTPAFATQPAISGDRIVWEDSRTGPVGIWGFELPGIIPERTLRVVPGKPFRLPFWARRGMSDSLEFELEAISGASLAESSAQIEAVRHDARGVSVGVVAGVLPAATSGPSVWILRARGAGGLSSEQRIEIGIRDLSD